MDFEFQPTLKANGLLIRPLVELDRDGLFEVASDPLIWEQHPNARYKPEIFNPFFDKSLESRGALLVIDQETGKIIGSNRFSKIAGTDDAIEIGWSFLSRNYWGGKTNRKVKSILMAHAFQYVNQVVYYIDKSNLRSAKATEKLGGKLLERDENNPIIRLNSNDWTYVIFKKDWID